MIGSGMYNVTLYCMCHPLSLSLSLPLSSTRPFLSTMEKKWIVFQLLKVLEECHNKKICHGDIKTENVLLTGWDWVLLSDFASFKPTTLPDVSEYVLWLGHDDPLPHCCCALLSRLLICVIVWNNAIPVDISIKSICGVKFVSAS